MSFADQNAVRAGFADNLLMKRRIMTKPVPKLKTQNSQYLHWGFLQLWKREGWLNLDYMENGV